MTNKNRKKKNGKHVTTGFEVEFFLLDKKTGAIAHAADDILERISQTSNKEAHNIVKESAKNLIEVGSYPDVDGANTMNSLMKGLKSLLYIADELGYSILQLGTYPGKFTPSLRSDARYKSQEKVHGKKRFEISGRCAGYHCHNSLPAGVFDKKTLMLKDLTNSKNQSNLISAHNLLIAVDPATTTLMQSSPFYQGKYIAKDSRMVMYRGGESLGLRIKGLYTNFARFGALPKYEHSGTDLIHGIEERYRDRIAAMVEAGVAEKDMPKYRSMLSTNWTPVKINPHGTLEQRGMDMNHLPIMLSVSVLLWRLLYYVQEKNYKVVSHDLAKKEPFKLEGDTIYIAPDAHVRGYLQKASVIEGLENDDIYQYCKRLVSLVKQLDGKRVDWLLKPLDTMLEERQTTSDKIIAEARELGHKDLKKPLPQTIAAEIAKMHSKQMFENIILLEKMIEENEKLTDSD